MRWTGELPTLKGSHLHGVPQLHVNRPLVLDEVRII